MDQISKLHNNQYGFLNEFHTNRTQAILEALTAEYGEAVISVAAKQSIDLYGLYQWHTERYVALMETLKDQYGQEIIDKSIEFQMLQEEGRGRAYAESTHSEFQKLVDHFTGGCNDRVIEDNEDYVVIKTGECFAGRIAYTIGKSEMLFPHHCGLDVAFVKGFNPNLKLEIQKTIIYGDACCLHKIWK